MHNEACRATHVRGEQSGHCWICMLCLNRRLQEVDAFVSQLARPDSAVIEQAVRRPCATFRRWQAAPMSRPWPPRWLRPAIRSPGRR